MPQAWPLVADFWLLVADFWLLVADFLLLAHELLEIDVSRDSALEQEYGSRVVILDREGRIQSYHIGVLTHSQLRCLQLKQGRLTAGSQPGD